MEFRVLGPLEVRDERGELLPVSAPMLQALLAALVLRPEQVVTVDDLGYQLWGEQPPTSLRTALRNYVMRLRKVLPPERIQTASGGYQLRARKEETDLGRFRSLHQQAREQATDDPATASSLLEEALSLWHGTPLAGLGDCPLRTVQQPRLEELQQTAREELFEVRLALGQHELLVDELLAAVRVHPLRERLTRQLMIALHRSGRSAEALGVFRETRRALVDELAIEPSPQLRELEEAILRGDASLALPRQAGHGDEATTAETAETKPDTSGTAPSGRPPPPQAEGVSPLAAVQFPAAPATFVARSVEVARLREWLGGAVAAPAICLLDGTGGVGKSSLALRCAHESAERFPDGMVHLDLHGADPSSAPLGTDDAVRRLLRALGEPPETVPTEPSEALARYHQLLRGQRVLVLLDNVHSAEQVRQLLPTHAGSACLVTSRTVLAGLGGRHLHLDVLRPADAVALVRTVSGCTVEAAEEAQWHELVDLCGRLPLALHIVAVRMASRPRWPVGEWVELLRDERRRLSELVVADRDVRASLLLSLDQLRASGDPTDRRAVELFPLLGVAAVSNHSPPTAAALAKVEESEASAALERLTDAQLVDSPRPRRYSLHDLIRAAAAGEAESLPPEQVGAALARLARWYLGTLHRLNEPLTVNEVNDSESRAARAHYTTGRSFDSAAEALAWADLACDEVVPFAEQLAAGSWEAPHALNGRPLDDFALQALLALDGYFSIRVRRLTQRQLGEAALHVAERRADSLGEAEALARLGKSAGMSGELGRAVELLERSDELFAELGREARRVTVLNNLVPCLAMQGRLSEAVATGEDALRLAEEHGPATLASALRNNLGRCHSLLGDHARAHALLLSNYHSVSDPRYRANTAHNLAEHHAELGEFAQAAEWARASLRAGTDQHIDAFARAEAYEVLGTALDGLGEPEAGGRARAAAIALLEEHAEPEAAELRDRLHEADRAAGVSASAATAHADKPVDPSGDGVVRQDDGQDEDELGASALQ